MKMQENNALPYWSLLQLSSELEMWGQGQYSRLITRCEDLVSFFKLKKFLGNLLLQTSFSTPFHIYSAKARKQCHRNKGTNTLTLLVHVSAGKTAWWSWNRSENMLLQKWTNTRLRRKGITCARMHWAVLTSQLQLAQKRRVHMKAKMQGLTQMPYHQWPPQKMHKP